MITLHSMAMGTLEKSLTESGFLHKTVPWQGLAKKGRWGSGAGLLFAFAYGMGFLLILVGVFSATFFNLLSKETLKNLISSILN